MRPRFYHFHCVNNQVIKEVNMSELDQNIFLKVWRTPNTLLLKSLVSVRFFFQEIVLN